MPEYSKVIQTVQKFSASCIFLSMKPQDTSISVQDATCKGCCHLTVSAENLTATYCDKISWSLLLSLPLSQSHKASISISYYEMLSVKKTMKTTKGASTATYSTPASLSVTRCGKPWPMTCRSCGTPLPCNCFSKKARSTQALLCS